MEFKQLLTTRYACKHYNSAKKISDEDMQTILEAGRLAPSAINLQPWHFLVASDEKSKAKLRPAVWEMNLDRFDKCSHVVAICARSVVTKDFITKVVDCEEQAGRYVDGDTYEKFFDSKSKFVLAHKGTPIDLIDWNARNTYLAFATMLYQAADLGIDSTAIEGFVPSVVDESLGLREKGLTCIAMAFFGYRAEDDSNTLDKRPKARLNKEDVITYL